MKRLTIHPGNSAVPVNNNVPFDRTPGSQKRIWVNINTTPKATAQPNSSTEVKRARFTGTHPATGSVATASSSSVPSQTVEATWMQTVSNSVINAGPSNGFPQFDQYCHIKPVTIFQPSTRGRSRWFETVVGTSNTNTTTAPSNSSAFAFPTTELLLPLNPNQYTTAVVPYPEPQPLVALKPLPVGDCVASSHKPTQSSSPWLKTVTQCDPSRASTLEYYSQYKAPRANKPWKVVAAHQEWTESIENEDVWIEKCRRRREEYAAKGWFLSVQSLDKVIEKCEREKREFEGTGIPELEVEELPILRPIGLERICGHEGLRN